MVNGTIDPKKADYLNPAWWRTVRWTLDEIERTELITAQTLDMHYHASCVGSTDIDFGNKHVEQALQVRSRLWSLRFPWLAQQSRAGEVKELTSAWNRLHGGSIDDPAVAKLVNDTVALMYARAAQGRKEAENAYRPRPRKARRNR